MTSPRRAGRPGLGRVLWIAGAGVVLVVVVLAWPGERAGTAGIPNEPPEIAVEPPWHLLAAPAPEATRMTSPPRPLNAAAVRRALDQGYPAALQDRGIGGAVTLWLEIGKDGRVEDAEVAESSGFQALDDAALSVIRMAKFEPARDDTGPVAVRLRYEIPFEAPTQASELGLARRTAQLVAVYLGATSCVPCQAPATKQAVREVLAAAEAAAREENLEFEAVGAALDKDFGAGLDFLASTAEFDQVVVGGLWNNTAVMDFIWSDPEAVAGIPQVVILTRMVEWDARQREAATDHVFVRLAGAGAMREWLDAGGKVFE